MEQIKKYGKINPGHNLNFRISKTEDIYEKTGGKADAPHRHDYYTVILTKSAKGKHVIDFHEFNLLPNQVYFVGPGQVHQVIEEEKPEGYALLFSPEFLVENNIPESFITNLNLFNDTGFAPPLEIDKNVCNILTNYCVQIESYVNSNMKLKEQAVGSLLQLFLIQCNNTCTIEFDTQTTQTGNQLLKDFKSLLDNNYKKEHKASFYASKLFITPDHLNRTIKSLTGKTSKEFIQSRIVLAAKRMILFTELTIKEIGYELGFSDPGNFSAFFKNCTGYPISEFKKSL